MAQDSPVKPGQEVLESPGWKTHTQWVAERVAHAREEGIRSGLENQTAAAIIANLYHECEVLDKKLRGLQDHIDARHQALLEMHVKSIQHIRFLTDTWDPTVPYPTVTDEGLDEEPSIDLVNELIDEYLNKPERKTL